MKPVTVTQVNEYIAKKLRDDLNLHGLVVEGEISGLSRSGQHYYLTLKDANSQIRAAIWGQNAAKIDMSLVENGKKIVAVCDISPYSKNGTYSLSIRHIEVAGEGILYSAILWSSSRFIYDDNSIAERSAEFLVSFTARSDDSPDVVILANMIEPSPNRGSSTVPTPTENSNESPSFL